jgi:hypothetical protein
VLLQEVWLGHDAAHLMRHGATGGLVHSMHFKSGIFGAGLVTLSRHPISAAQFFRWGAATGCGCLGGGGRGGALRPGSWAAGQLGSWPAAAVAHGSRQARQRERCRPPPSRAAPQ